MEVEGETYPLKTIAQVAMPNPQTITINMSSYPEVRAQNNILWCLITELQSINAVVSALRVSDLNLNPLVDKKLVKIPIPK